jgi:site-specific recombinase XerD
MTPPAADPLVSLGEALTLPGPLTLTQAAASYLRWLEAHHYPENTRLSYQHGLSMFLSFAAGARLRLVSDVTILACDGYFLWLRQRDVSAATVAHRRSVLVSLWKWLEHEGLVERNIPAKTYPIKTPKRMVRYLEPHQIDEFLARLSALPDLLGRRDYAVVASFFYGGVRVGELVALGLADVDLVAGRIRVLLGKGKKDRTVVVPPRLAPILRDYLQQVRPALVQRPMGRIFKSRRQWRMSYWADGKIYTRATGAATEQEARQVLAATAPQAVDGGRLFVNANPKNGGRQRDGQALTTRSVWRMISRRAQQLLGLKLAPHMLRHTCATYLLYHDAKLETIQRHLGHEDVRTTMIYLHVPQKRQEEEIGRIFA